MIELNEFFLEMFSKTFFFYSVCIEKKNITFFHNKLTYLLRNSVLLHKIFRIEESTTISQLFVTIFVSVWDCNNLKPNSCHSPHHHRLCGVHMAGKEFSKPPMFVSPGTDRRQHVSFSSIFSKMKNSFHGIVY